MAISQQGRTSIRMNAEEFSKQLSFPVGSDRREAANKDDVNAGGRYGNHS